MTQKYTRDEIIDSGISYGMGYGDIDRSLRKHGHSGLTLAEANRIQPMDAGTILKNAGHNFGNLIAGIPTALGNVYASARRGTIKEDAKQLVRDFPNAALSTYNTSIEKIRDNGVSGLGWDMLQGVTEHPIEAGIDFTTLGGGKALRAGKNALAESKTLNAFVKDKPLLRSAKASILPTKAQKKISDALNSIEVDAKVATGETAKEIQELNRMRLKKNANLEKAVENARLGLMDGTKETQELTKQIHKIANMQSSKAIELGLLDKDYHYKNTMAQYITDISNGKRIHDKSFKLVEKGLKGELEKPSEIKLFNKAKKAVDSGNVSYLSQALEPTRGMGFLKGSVVADPERHGYFTKGRWAGLTSPAALSKVLPETFEYVDEQIRRGKMSKEGINYLLDNTATKATLDDVKNYIADVAPKDEVFISKKSFDNIIKEGLAGKPQFAKDISKLDETESVINKYSKYKNKPIGKDIYKVNVEDLRALANHVEGLKSNKLLSLMKKNMLVYPKWVTENRVGNWINNAMFGTRIDHYGKALLMMEKAPKWLDQMTNYASFTGGEALGSGMRTRFAYQAAKNKILEGLKEIKSWEPKLILKSGSKILDGLNDIFRLPVVAPEAWLEKLDRLANYIKQTERYAKKIGKSFDEVYDMSLKDKDLFFEINQNVERELGNYTGRNLYTSNSVYNFLNNLYPFWKFPVESMKTTFRQMVEHPIKYQTFVHTPSKYGARKWEELREALDLPEDDYTGGALYMEPNKPNEPYQFLSPSGTPYEAIGRLFNIIGGNERSSMLGVNPMLKLPYQWIMGVNGMGTDYRLNNVINISDKQYELDPNSPLQIQAGDGSVVGIKLDENGFPVEHDYSLLTDMPKVALKDILKYSVVPYNLAGGLWRNILYSATNKPMYSQYANVLNPFDKGDITSLAKRTLMQKLGSQIAIPITQTYGEFHMNKNQLKTLIRKIQRKLQGKG